MALTSTIQQQEDTGSHNPSQQAGIEPAQSKQSKRKRSTTSKRLVSFSRCKSTAEASANIQSTSRLHLDVDQQQDKAAPLRKRIGKQLAASKKSIM